MFILLFFFCSFSPSSPWGNDREIAHCFEERTSLSKREEPLPQSSLVRSWFSFPFLYWIDFYQQHLSPTSGPRSHFLPTSSAYMKGCIEKYGFLGYLMGMDRLIRENDEEWIYTKREVDQFLIKWDPP